eukprot:1138818-Pelagomonas_calceolata.AAC.13
MHRDDQSVQVVLINRRVGGAAGCKECCWIGASCMIELIASKGGKCGARKLKTASLFNSNSFELTSSTIMRLADSVNTAMTRGA